MVAGNARLFYVDVMTGRARFGSRGWFLGLVLAQAAVLSLACGPGRGDREANMAILRQRPSAGCSSVGRVTGNGGGFGGAWLDNKTLETYAMNDLLKQAADQGATHVLVTGTDYKKNQAGRVEAAAMTGEAFVCTGELRFPEPQPGAPPASPVVVAKSSAAMGSGLRALDSSLWRAWQGNVKQPGFGSFDVELALSRSGASGACGTANYPSLGCRGVLTKCQVLADGAIEAEQRLDVVGGCVDRGRIRFKLEGSRLNASYLQSNGQQVAAGQLSPRSNDHPLLAASRQGLPALPPPKGPIFDEEIFEAMPQFLPEVLVAGFVTDEPATTKVGADGRFKATRSYLRQDGAVIVVALALVGASYDGAGATLAILQKSAGTRDTLAGFPALRRPAPAGARQVTYVVLSPRLQIEIEATGVSEGLLDGLLRSLSPGYLAQVESHGRLALAGLTQSKEFEDPQGQKVRLASGQSAFADRLIHMGAGAGQGLRRDGNLTLGPPDFDGGSGYYTLGCRGALAVAFEDNVLEDGPGPDLHIFEIGGFVEAMSVRISEDGNRWLDAGQVKGQPASLDIAGVGVAGAQYRFVEVTDVGSECGNEQAGADIDAIGALHGEFLATPKPVAGRAAASRKPGKGAVDDPRLIAEAVQRGEGVPLKMDVKGKDWTLSEAKGGYSVRSSGWVRGDVDGDGRRDAVVITTRGDDRRREHQLEIYTEREKGLGPLAQAVIGYDEPAPTSGSLRVNGNRIQFTASSTAFTYELRHGSLIRVQP